MPNNMGGFTDKQPERNDIVLHCGHLERNGQHFWYSPGGTDFRRPDGTMGTAQWIVCCRECFSKCGGNPAKLQIQADGVWIGDEPIVCQDELSE